MGTCIGESVAEPGPAPRVPPSEFRHVLGHLPTGVTVITAYTREGPTGMAANSVTAVSLEPPLILLCPARSSATWPLIRAARQFCVSVLAAHQEGVARGFAARGADRFAGIGWHPRRGGPALDDAVAWIDAELLQEHDAGDHTIAVARVVAVDASAGRVPLVFFRGGYGQFRRGRGAGA